MEETLLTDCHQLCPSPTLTDPLPEDHLLFLSTGTESGGLDAPCGMEPGDQRTHDRGSWSLYL